jgi:hypothetical protein
LGTRPTQILRRVRGDRIADRRGSADYLVGVIGRMAKRHPINRRGEFLPWNWQGQPAKLAA